MSDLPPNPEIKPQAPKKSFRYFCQKVLPAVYDDSLSYYELLCKLTDKINEIITGDQSQVGAIEELQSLYEDLRSYIENLDLTDEVELALDKMAEDGELERIMALYLRAMNVYGFKDKSEMKQSQVIGDGSICKLLGQTNYQTGDGAYYLIRERLAGDVIDDDNIILLTAKPSCVGEKIPEYYINELATTVGTLSDNLDALSTLHSNEVGDLNNLTTTVKTNLVGAINDVNGKTIEVSQGGTGATSASDARTNIDVYSKTETDTSIATAISTAISGLGTVFKLMGSVATPNDLPQSNNNIGDVYYVESKSVGYIWMDDNGTERWEEIGEITDTSNFLTKSGLLATTGTATNNTMHQSAITTALSLKANITDLATVATSGSYTDLTSTPTQLTDFSGTLPIYKGGTGATTESGARENLDVLHGTVLYENSAGTAGTITIQNDSFYNYDWIRIFYNTDANVVQTTDISLSNNRNAFALSVPVVYTPNNAFMCMYDTVNIVNNSLTHSSVNGGFMSVVFPNNSTSATSGTDMTFGKNYDPAIWIYKIVGYSY